MKKLLGLTSIMLASGIAVFANPVIPNYDTFGTLSGATFAGTGIPNTSVAAVKKIIQGNGDVITLGLTATARYSNPTVGDNGAGVFYATPGLNDGLAGKSVQATWNWDFYFDASNSKGTAGNYTYKLFYGTDASSLVSFAPTVIGDNAATPGKGGQNSENLNFSGFRTPISFDPNANAIYSFELVSYDSTGTQQLGEVAINVDVGTVPDGGMTVVLLGGALMGLAALRRKLAC